MARQTLALVDVLAEIPDFRQSQGKRYALTAVLSLAVAAILCGYKSYSAIAEWGRHYGLPLIEALGFATDKTPCAATLHNILSGLDKEALEVRLAQWAQALLQASTALADDNPEPPSREALAVDSKTLRGSKKQGALAAHLLSALSQRLGLTLFQHPVSDHTNEIGAILEMLKSLFLQGKTLTFDALLTQRKVAQHLVSEGADYVMMVKENQPQLHAIIEGAIEGIPFYGEAAELAQTLDIEFQKKIFSETTCTGDPLWSPLLKSPRISHRGDHRGSPVQGF